MKESHLILHAKVGDHRKQLLRFMQEGGIAPDRITFSGMLPWEDYLAMYQKIDIALDPFPCGGGTTTCDALWMGAPVVTLTGKTAVGRGGVSILTNVGLPELVAKTHEEYVRIAADLAKDTARLQELRASLRSRMMDSPLMNAPQFATDMEALYRQMWVNWCADRSLPENGD